MNIFKNLIIAGVLFNALGAPLSLSAMQPDRPELVATAKDGGDADEDRKESAAATHFDQDKEWFFAKLLLFKSYYLLHGNSMTHSIGNSMTHSILNDYESGDAYSFMRCRNHNDPFIAVAIDNLCKNLEMKIPEYNSVEELCPLIKEICTKAYLKSNKTAPQCLGDFLKRMIDEGDKQMILMLYREGLFDFDEICPDEFLPSIVSLFFDSTLVQPTSNEARKNANEIYEMVMKLNNRGAKRLSNEELQACLSKVGKNNFKIRRMYYAIVNKIEPDEQEHLVKLSHLLTSNANPVSGFLPSSLCDLVNGYSLSRTHNFRRLFAIPIECRTTPPQSNFRYLRAIPDDYDTPHPLEYYVDEIQALIDKNERQDLQEEANVFYKLIKKNKVTGVGIKPSAVHRDLAFYTFHAISDEDAENETMHAPSKALATFLEQQEYLDYLVSVHTAANESSSSSSARQDDQEAGAQKED